MYTRFSHLCYYMLHTTKSLMLFVGIPACLLSKYYTYEAISSAFRMMEFCQSEPFTVTAAEICAFKEYRDTLLDNHLKFVSTMMVLTVVGGLLTGYTLGLRTAPRSDNTAMCDTLNCCGVFSSSTAREHHDEAKKGSYQPPLPVVRS